MMRPLIALCCSLVLALPAAAETLVSEITGTWRGGDLDGWTYRAQLTSDDEDLVRLRIWNSADPTPPEAEGEPDLDSSSIALATFATRQEVVAVDKGDGTAFQIVTEYEDETAKGTTLVEVRYFDEQYRVVGFSNSDTMHEDGYVSTCVLDFRAGTAIVNDAARDLPVIAPDDLLARDWTYNTPYDRNYCTAE